MHQLARATLEISDDSFHCDLLVFLLRALETSYLVQTSLFCLQMQPEMVSSQDFVLFFFFLLETFLFLDLLTAVALSLMPLLTCPK